MKIAALFAAAVLSTAAAHAEAANVGFSELRIANGADKPLVIGVWYPTDAPTRDHLLGPFVQTVAPDGPITGEHLKLIVMSHGNGGIVPRALRHRHRPGDGWFRRRRRQSHR